MPFHGREKQTIGLLPKPWLSLFPKKKVLSPLLYACVLSNSNMTLLQYCITNISSDTKSITQLSNLTT